MKMVYQKMSCLLNLIFDSAMIDTINKYEKECEEIKKLMNSNGIGKNEICMLKQWSKTQVKYFNKRTF